MLSRLVSDRFGCISSRFRLGCPFGAGFWKGAARAQGPTGTCWLPPKQRTPIGLPNPLHCPRPLTSADAPRSIPSFWLYQDDFTHWGWRVAQRPSTSRGLTSSSQLAPSTWAPQLAVALDSNIKLTQGRKLNPRHNTLNLLAALILFVNTRANDARLRCLAKSLGFPTGPPRSLLPAHTSDAGRRAAFSPLNPKPQQFCRIQVIPVTRQHGQLSMPSAPSMETLGSPMGSPCKTPRCQDPQLLVVFPGVHGDVRVVVKHLPPRFSSRGCPRCVQTINRPPLTRSVVARGRSGSTQRRIWGLLGAWGPPKGQAIPSL